ncbi:o-succinylbenzoate synthase [Algoriphagus winogradskyi]|uniref:O-succinylbenzoate synthase n=1 Tax=Algoriphagus winogradskyi TaxID=237017 RepID=A0ABY1NXD0_9BACT|nr:o-succinylbenzoate synthase [Algoriphagus winogradskyi]SMP20943.1 o-succinylbenzoate synthase [Algoriphagus winogradskyi]
MTDSAKITFEYLKRTLVFKFDAGTSRGVLKKKDVFWIKAFYPDQPEIAGWGEAAPLVKLSLDDRPDFENILQQTLEQMATIAWSQNENEVLSQVGQLIPVYLPSIRFGLETAILDLINGGKKKILGQDFFEGNRTIPINGLIWMGEKDFMLEQINEKFEQGFDCIKMKIGAIDFQQELELLSYIRKRYSKDQITLRVDANGAFSPEEALAKLHELAEFDLHSIEQPIAAGNWEAMRKLCEATPLPIALDEELIGVENKGELLDAIRPQHIILKPTLLGGILETKEWIALAEERNIGWWMTSALESNIGLNAIAQLADSLGASIPQGLGTGKLYQNNLKSPLEIDQGHIRYNSQIVWEQPS